MIPAAEGESWAEPDKGLAGRRLVGVVKSAAAGARGVVLDILFPRRCAGCGAEGRFFCPRCLASLEPIGPPRCEHCWRPGETSGLCRDCRSGPRHLAGIRSAFLYRGALRRAVLQFKYEGVSALAEELGPMLAAAINSQPIGFDIVTPVPLFGDRMRERGYNQAALLARRVASPEAPLVERALRRVRRTLPQARQGSRRDRFRNVDGAFAAEAELVAGRRVLIIDDVCTTGATLEACGAALRRAGAASAWGFTLAREA